MPSVVAHSFSSSILEAETDGSLISRLTCSKMFQANQDYLEKPCLQKQQQNLFYYYALREPCRMCCMWGVLMPQR